MPEEERTTDEPPKRIAPRQQQIPIENMSSEELALLEGEQYKTIIKAQGSIIQSQGLIMQCHNNLAAISNVLGQRKKILGCTKKEATDGKQGN